jgi:hypothetical protein
MNRRLDRSNRNQKGRIMGHMKRGYSMKNPWGCTWRRRRWLSMLENSVTEPAELLVKNPKDQACIEATLSHTQTGTWLKRSR